MHRSAQQLREDAERIWRAGVESVKPQRLIVDQLQIDGQSLRLADFDLPLDAFRRITVVGAGKGGAGMVRGLEALLGEDLLRTKHVQGLVCVPEDCVGPTQAVELVSGRPAGINEPRPEGAAAANRMLELVGSLGPQDLCVCVISGGGSALLPAPVDGISLQQKISVTRLLSGAGATINQLNAVRCQISRIKGGGLATACRAGMLVSLIVSDVLGDPLDVIASGPTIAPTTSSADAVAVFEELDLVDHPDAVPILSYLDNSSAPGVRALASCEVRNVILANNATAVDAAGMEAERLGYNHAMDCATASEGPAEDIGRHLASMARQMRDQAGPNCLITGGEPTVKLAAPEIRGRGGRNQQLALAALQELGDCHDIAFLSGGTDGEDGPTDAAGAVFNQSLAAKASQQGLDIADTLRRNDAYPFFEACDGLLQTGPTHTNVCDLRVVVVNQPTG